MKPFAAFFALVFLAHVWTVGPSVTAMQVVDDAQHGFDRVVASVDDAFSGRDPLAGALGNLVSNSIMELASPIAQSVGKIGSGQEDT